MRFAYGIFSFHSGDRHGDSRHHLLAHLELRFKRLRGYYGRNTVSLWFGPRGLCPYHNERKETTMNFANLTPMPSSSTNQNVFINPAFVTHVGSDAGGTTIIFFSGGTSTTIDDTPARVVEELIKASNSSV